MFSVTIDTSEFMGVLDKILAKVDSIDMKSLEKMGDELLRVSNHEVPHDEGILSGSGSVDPDAGNGEVVVGYHTPYAARLHEHPEYRFQKGRKGKYLEDPLKKNLVLWLKLYADGIEDVLK